jgi:diguanylate cyclase (GGDEF)-like protein
MSDTRDLTASERDSRTAAEITAGADPNALLLRELEKLRTQAAAERARAAADRARAATERASAARERARLEAELLSAHLDDLTGAYRREMGRLALSHEIDRAQRSDGRFVVAFVDVDGLKAVNDHDGHAAGDRVLQVVVSSIRKRLRSFDPIVRFGGDEFVCGLGGTDIAEAERRFGAIAVAIKAEAHASISVGLAAFAMGDTADQLTQRADAAMLETRAARQSGQ